ncbi:MAG TPA: hypothetical protein VG142_02200 [Trebonia sp.]|jgi:hypothetical protein|nr:hypothetical protein [Trebonia sp.]
MGASEWEYIVPYRDDLQGALDDLRRQVFAVGEWVSPVTRGLAAPDSVEALWEQEYYWEFMGENGTHSIIDVAKVVPYDMGEQLPGSVCAFTDEEAEDLFGTTRPARPEFERVHEEPIWSEYVAGRGTGRALVLWADGKPSEIVFWGYSGDLLTQVRG